MKTYLKLYTTSLLILMLISSIAFGQEVRVEKRSLSKTKEKASAWLGVMLQDVNEKIAKKEKLPSEEGAYIQDVVDDSPADSAGIQRGDVIIDFNGKKIFDSDDLQKAVQRSMPGTKVSLTIFRDGEKKTLQLVIGKKKIARRVVVKKLPPLPEIHAIVENKVLGLHVSTLNEQLAEYFGAPNNEGVLVEEVETESQGDKAGFKAGDVIVRAGKKTIDDAMKLRKEIGKHSEGEKVDFEIIRRGTKKVISVTAEEDQDLEHEFFFQSPSFQRHMESMDDAGFEWNIQQMCPDMDLLHQKIEQSVDKMKHLDHTIREQRRTVQHTVDGAAML